MNNEESVYATATATDLPFSVQVLPHVPVELGAGVSASLKIWLPQVSEGERTPAVLEAIPYRKDDNSLVDDEARYGYFAGHGYACVRMELRGSGSSTGILEDEYSAQEHADIRSVIAWISEQEWCDGNIGMMGISWSGFNSLQVAATRPSALKTVISVCSTDDRYDNDVHYMGGSLLAFYQNLWGTSMHINNMRPPDPYYIGESWRDEWLQRLHHNPVYTAIWTQHQRRDSFWQHGSVAEDYSAITIPTLMVGGWADPYTDSVFRMMQHAGDHVRGLVGPWSHTWPERPVPGPAIGFLQECVRWWDAWLKGIDNGVRTEPRLRFYQQEGEALDPQVSYRNGEWFESDAVEGLGVLSSWNMGSDGTLGQSDLPGGIVEHCSPLTLGYEARHFEPMGGPGDIPTEQSADDTASLTFTTQPLEQDLEICGNPVLRLRIASNEPDAFVFVRLTDVHPDGRSFLITRGNLNLAHRDGHNEEVAPVPVGEFLDYEIPLKVIAERLPAGHRLRVSVSTNYWPWLWPSPRRATISIDTAHSALELPLRDRETTRPLSRDFSQAEIARPPRVESSSVGESGWNLSRNEQDGTWTLVRAGGEGGEGAEATKHYPHGLTTVVSSRNSWTISEDDPLSARMDVQLRQQFIRDDWHVDVELESQMWSDAENFYVRTSVSAREGTALIYAHDTTHTIPRDQN